jgi:hypothetical protein
MLLEDQSQVVPAAPVVPPVPDALPPGAEPPSVRVRWWWVVLGALVLGALSLIPTDASPTYDPWAWIVWGREVAHGDLSTVDGPSWKPLPVLFTTVFSLFGDAAPALWLVIARAGAVLAAVLAWRVGRRLGGTVAGAAAAAAVLLAPWTLRNAGLGNSEPLMFAFVLGAIDRHLAGAHRSAFGFGVLAALLRPECWPFLGLYGLWLLWRDRREALLPVLAGFGALPVLWFGPELWGSGRLFRAAERAKHPRADSPAFADNPAAKVLENAASLVPTAAWVGLAVAAVLIGLRRVRRADARIALGLVAMAIVWLGLVALMTKDGFSGSARYLVTPVVLLLVVACAGFGWLADELRGRVPVAVLAAAAVAVIVVPWVGRIGDAVDDVQYQGALPHRLAEGVDRAGGAERLRACGTPTTGAFFVPAVAWQLGVHTSEVEIEPVGRGAVFRVETNPGWAPAPSLATLGDAPQQTLAIAPHWRIVGSGCR